MNKSKQQPAEDKFIGKQAGLPEGGGERKPSGKAWLRPPRCTTQPRLSLLEKMSQKHLGLGA